MATSTRLAAFRRHVLRTVAIVLGLLAISIAVPLAHVEAHQAGWVTALGLALAMSAALAEALLYARACALEADAAEQRERSVRVQAIAERVEETDRRMTLVQGSKP